MGEKSMGNMKVLSAFLLSVFVSSGFGGIITFDPIVHPPVPNGPLDSVSFSVVVQTEFQANDFDGISVVIGTDAPGFGNGTTEKRINVHFSDGWKDKFADEFGNLPVFYDMGLYPSDIGLFYGINDGTVGSPSLLLGTVVISTKDLSPGDYTVRVDEDPTQEMNVLYLSGVTDPLKSASATFTVIPEPASLLLLLSLGVWGLRPKNRHD